jgi:nitrite reductase/ring-hydroxylating ferredoxin subunit
VRVDLGPVESFVDGKIGLVRIPSDEVGILNWKGTLYAIRNWCSHQGGPICNGRVIPKVTSDEAGMLDTDHDVPVIACPWHDWEFDARSGRALSDDKFRLKMWPVETEDGRAYLEMRDRPAAESETTGKGSES